MLDTILRVQGFPKLGVSFWVSPESGLYYFGESTLGFPCFGKLPFNLPLSPLPPEIIVLQSNMEHEEGACQTTTVLEWVHVSSILFGDTMVPIIE